MKLAVTSRGTTLDSPVDGRFGRAAYILVVDIDTLEVEVINNKENADAFKGAGIQAAVAVSERGADVLLTGFCGPNAFKTLTAAKIKVVNNISGTVKDVVDLFKEGKMEYATQPNTDGHW